MAIRLLLLEIRKNTLFQFKGILKVTFGLLVLQLALLCFQLDVYADLVIAPLLYLYILNQGVSFEKAVKGQFLHLSFFGILIWLTLFSKSDFFLLINAIYLMFYSFLIQQKLRRKRAATDFLGNAHIFVSFCVFYFYVVAFLLVIEFVEGNFMQIFVFRSQFLLIGMLVTMISFSFYLLCDKEVLRGENREPKNDVLKPVMVNQVVSVVGEGARFEIVDKITSFFEKSDLYLQANFTLEDLAVIVDVPRTVLSEVMNKEMKTGFYAILGEYRINYAKKLLLAQENFTIESLVYQCGFHSKSTFNKYFKHFVGQTPSSFRNQNIEHVRPL